MPTIKISDLPSGDDSISNSDALPIVDTESSTTKKVTVGALQSYFNTHEHGGIDSAATVGIITETVDSDYVNALVTIPEAGIDSAATVAIITETVDSDYVNALVTAPEVAQSLSSDPILNTDESVYNDNGFGGPDGQGVVDPEGTFGWYWTSPGGSGTDQSFQWRLFANTDGPSSYSVDAIDYMFFVIDVRSLGAVFINLYTAGLNPAPSAFRSRFNFAINSGNFPATGQYVCWATPPGSSVTESDVEVFPWLPRIQLPYDPAFSSGELDTSETIKALAIQSSTGQAAGNVEFVISSIGYVPTTGEGQAFDLHINPDLDVSVDPSTIDASLLDFSNVQDSAGAVEYGFIYRTTDGTLKVKVGTSFDAIGALSVDTFDVDGVATQTSFVRPKHAFILAGQSNMVGRADFDGGTTHPANVYQYNRAGNLVAAAPPLDHRDENPEDMGLDISFSEAYMAANPDVDLILIPCADGGTGFSSNDWNPGDTVYEDMVTRVAAAFASNPDLELKGFLWHQGERDKNGANRENYPTVWNAMINDFISRSVMTVETPVVTGGLFEANADAIAMSAVIEGIADDRDYATFVDVSDTTAFDNLHFDAASLRVIGGRYYTQWLNAVAEVPVIETITGSGVLEAQPSVIVANGVSEGEVDERTETGAVAHWLFGTDNTAREDLVSGRVALGSVASTASNHIRTNATPQSGLDTQIAGSSEETMIVVSQRAGSGNIIEYGNLKNVNDGDGRAVFIGGNRQRFNDRDGVLFVEMEDPYSPTNSEWIFSAFSYTNTGTNAPDADVVTFTSRDSGNLSNTGTGPANNTNTDNLGIGNLNYDATNFDASHRYAEVIIFDTALTLAEIEDVFARSGARMADRGITLEGYSS